MKTIKDFDLNGKKVLIRADLNVPIKDNVITDDYRIKQSLETIKYAINNNAKVIVLSHLGKVKEESDKTKNTLRPVSIRLGELLNKPVLFSPNTKGKELEDMINNMENGDVLLIENTRFEDLNGKLESGNDLELGKYWASLGDIFINDAFGTSHRSHASNAGISKHLDWGIGFLMEKELVTLNKVTTNPERPFTVILGGAKVSDKIGLIENLVTKADYILVGGGMAFTFLKALEFKVGGSLVDNESLDFCKKILEEYPNKIILPIDVIKSLSKEQLGKECFINEIGDEEIGFDIGRKTVELFSQYLKTSKTIIWNGPMGMFEKPQFSYGTKYLCENLKQIDAIKVAGGGDTAAAIRDFGYEESFTHISTGGGATLVLLEGKELVGLK